MLTWRHPLLGLVINIKHNDIEDREVVTKSCVKMADKMVARPLPPLKAFFE